MPCRSWPISPSPPQTQARGRARGALGEHRLDCGLATMEALLGNRELRGALSCEASAVFFRGCMRIMRDDRAGSLADCEESIRLAEKSSSSSSSSRTRRLGRRRRRRRLWTPTTVVMMRTRNSRVPGLAWSFRGSYGQALQGAGRFGEALVAFEEVVDAADAALKEYEEDGRGEEEPADPRCRCRARRPAGEAGRGGDRGGRGQAARPVGAVGRVGGRERDPMVQAKVCQYEYSAAALLLQFGASANFGWLADPDAPLPVGPGRACRLVAGGAETAPAPRPRAFRGGGGQGKGPAPARGADHGGFRQDRVPDAPQQRQGAPQHQDPASRWCDWRRRWRCRLRVQQLRDHRAQRPQDVLGVQVGGVLRRELPARAGKRTKRNAP